MVNSGMKLLAILSVALLAACNVEESRAPSVAETEGSGSPAVAASAGTAPAPAAAREGDLPPPLEIEELGRVNTLPFTYPEDWVMVDEASFFSQGGGKVIIVDIAEPKQPLRIKGMMSKNYVGNFTQSAKRGEFYIIETFHERVWRGKRYDYLVIYDKQTLKIKKEIEWPTLRLQALPERYAMAVSRDESLLYAANFTPAASFTVVALDTHEIVGTIATPGCVLTYPTGRYSVTSICSNGGLMTTVLNADGSLKRQERIAPFFDTDRSPVFEWPLVVDGMAHIPSFTGDVHVFDFSGEVAEFVDTWSLVTDRERVANWRPGGISVNARDDDGEMYVIMQPDGAEGTQTHGGSHVWVFDVDARRRLRTVEIPNWAVSIQVTRGKNPKLVVTNGNMALDVFDAKTGEYIQTVADFGNMTPLLVHKAL